jgi:2-methylisocitrate lyase-like PEP mutase family enzyme
MTHMTTSVQVEKAERFRALHGGGRILVLPNIWDAGGARMLEWLGYPAVARARAYLQAGADGFYPITLRDLPTLKRLHAAIPAPINVLAPTAQATLRELEDAGIARLSLGPALMWASLTLMRKIAVELQHYGSFDLFRRDMISTNEIKQFVSKEPMR